MKKLLSLIVCAILILNCVVLCVSCDMGELLEEPEETKADKTEKNTQKTEQTSEFETNVDTEIDTETSTDKPTEAETQRPPEINTGAVEQPSDSEQTSEYVTEHVFEEVSVCSHEYGDYKAVNEASCTEGGLVVRECGLCGKTQQKEIVARGHEFSAWEIKESISNNLSKCERICCACGISEEKNISFANGGTATSFSGGDGTESNPYIISDASELYWLAYTVNCGIYDEEYNSAYYKLTNDICLLGYQWDPIGTYNFDKANIQFLGNFDGNGHAIYNLTITDPESYYEYFGLFGSLGKGAVVKNVTVENIIISVDSSKEIHIGGIAGNAKDATIENCHVSGYVTVKSGREEVCVGGLVGKNNTTNINSCSADISIDAIASNSGGYEICLGGLIGEASKSIITNSYSRGSIYAVAEYYVNAGGFIGEITSKDTSISDSYSNCEVYAEGGVGACGYGYLGGFIGEISAAASNITIQNCYATGNVELKADSICVGGFIGEVYDDSTVFTDCYATGDVFAYSETYAGAGGFAGSITKASLNNCYSHGNVTANASSDDGYTEVGGFAGQLRGAGALKVLMSNCFATGDVFSETGSYGYAGGLAGCVNNAIVENCYSTGDVNAKNGYAGGFIGELKGDIKNCYATGNVICIGEKESVDVYSGGLVGHVSTANISHCYATGDVCATSIEYDVAPEAGGLIAHCGGANVFIENCYAQGNVYSEASGVSGSVSSGGLIGNFYSTGKVNNCYAVGDVTAISHSVGYVEALAGGLIGNSKGTVTNCVAYGHARAIVDDIEGKAISDKLIAYINKSSSVLENNYTYNNSSAYQNGELVAENQNAISVSDDKLNDKSFYINELNWDTEIWSFTELDIENNKLPTLN